MMNPATRRDAQRLCVVVSHEVGIGKERPVRLDRSALLVLASAALILALCLAFASEARAARGERTCRPAGITVLRLNAAVVVGRKANGVTFACFRATRRVTPLSGPLPPDPFARRVSAQVRALSGRFVGYRWSVSQRDGRIKMRVLDARRGSVVVDEVAFSGAGVSDTQQGFAMTDVLLSPSGGLAWAATLPEYFDGRREVRWARPGGRVSVIAAAPDIEPRSLALSAKYLYWQQAGQAMSTPLSDK